MRPIPDARPCSLSHGVAAAVTRCAKLRRRPLTKPWSAKHKLVTRADSGGLKFSLSNSYAQPLSHADLVELTRARGDHPLGCRLFHFMVFTVPSVVPAPVVAQRNGLAMAISATNQDVVFGCATQSEILVLFAIFLARGPSTEGSDVLGKSASSDVRASALLSARDGRLTY